MKKLFIVMLSSLLLNACQTHLPIISEHTGSTDDTDNKPCASNTEGIKTADIDYLLYANRMIDTMIKDDKVQKIASSKRLKIVIQAIKNTDNTAQIDMASVNSAVKNRLLRSGQFIVVKNTLAADVQLSGVIEKKQKKLTYCIENMEQFSLQLEHRHSKQLIWSDKKQFK